MCTSIWHQNNSDGLGGFEAKGRNSTIFQNDLAFIWIFGNSNTYIAIYPFVASVNKMTYSATNIAGEQSHYLGYLCL